MFCKQHEVDAAKLEWLNASIANLNVHLAPRPRLARLNIQDPNSPGLPNSFETNAYSAASSVNPFDLRAFTISDPSAHSDSTDEITDARGLPGTETVRYNMGGPFSISPSNPRAFASRDPSAHTNSTDGIPNARGLAGAAAAFRGLDGRFRRDRHGPGKQPGMSIIGEWISALVTNAAGFSLSATRNSTGQTTIWQSYSQGASDQHQAPWRHPINVQLFPWFANLGAMYGSPRPFPGPSPGWRQLEGRPRPEPSGLPSHAGVGQRNFAAGPGSSP